LAPTGLGTGPLEISALGLPEGNAVPRAALGGGTTSTVPGSGARNVRETCGDDVRPDETSFVGDPSL
jgi:hypothetical protein